ncbi:MAG: AAA family ATPase [Thermoguttaceae bacterium]
MIEGFWIKNYGPLENIALGTSHLQTLVFDGEETSQTDYRLGPVTLIAGKCDVGKSSIMDVFHFISDSLLEGVDVACVKRGGFNAIRTHGSNSPISFGVNFRCGNNPSPLTYAINIGCTNSGTPRVDSEALVYRSARTGGVSAPILLFQNYPRTTRQITSRDNFSPLHIQELRRTDFRHLGLAKLGEYVNEYPDVALIKNFLANWYLSCFTPHDARGLSPVVPVKHLHHRGDSLVNVVREMEAKHHDLLTVIFEKVAKRLPGIEKITYERTESGRILLYFTRKGSPIPLSAQRMSDGLLRLFAHLMVLEDTQISPFVGIEEPENGLDPQLLELFVESLIHQVVEVHTSQFLITTHSETMVDFIRPESVWIFEKIDNKTSVRRASDDPIISSYLINNEELPSKWFSTGDFFKI